MTFPRAGETRNSLNETPLVGATARDAWFVRRRYRTFLQRERPKRIELEWTRMHKLEARIWGQRPNEKGR